MYKPLPKGLDLHDLQKTQRFGLTDLTSTLSAELVPDAITRPDASSAKIQDIIAQALPPDDGGWEAAPAIGGLC